jgi:trans-aconitate 2-methyltransferase
MDDAVSWDPDRYDTYAEERGRPFVDLVARVRTVSPAVVVDLGCGPGSLTRSLVDRWPDARIVGVDSSPAMIEAAAARAIPGRLDFVHADLREWEPVAEPDVLVCNAALQWVPGHLELLPRFAGWLRPAGVLAFQVPDNFADPSHTVIRDIRTSPRWRDRLGADADRRLAVERPETYLAALVAAGLRADVWQTTYLHLLAGPDPVLEWVQGTALRPGLDLLAGDERAAAELLAEVGAGLRQAYPPGPSGTVFPFRRTFAVGHAGGLS